MQRCALCNTRFHVEDGHVECWIGRDQRYYCCRGHADFAVAKALAALGPFAQIPLRHAGMPLRAEIMAPR
jgi:hypothetical protein